MDLVTYIDKEVHIKLNNGFHYEGICISADDDSITVIDRRKKSVTVPKSSIEFVEEK